MFQAIQHIALVTDLHFSAGGFSDPVADQVVERGISEFLFWFIVVLGMWLLGTKSGWKFLQAVAAITGIIGFIILILQ